LTDNDGRGASTLRESSNRRLHNCCIARVILKVTWDSWRTVSTTEPGELVDLREH
jgi:hypothetical protein